MEMCKWVPDDNSEFYMELKISWGVEKLSLGY